MTDSKEPSKKNESPMTPEQANEHFDQHFPHVVNNQLNREEKEGAYEKLGAPEQLRIARRRVRRSMSGTRTEGKNPSE